MVIGIGSFYHQLWKVELGQGWVGWISCDNYTCQFCVLVKGPGPRKRFSNASY